MSRCFLCSLFLTVACPPMWSPYLGGPKVMPLATLKHDAPMRTFTSTHATMSSLGGLGMLTSHMRTERARHGQSKAKAEPFHPHLDDRSRKATSTSFALPKDTPRANCCHSRASGSPGHLRLVGVAVSPCRHRVVDVPIVSGHLAMRRGADDARRHPRWSRCVPLPPPCVL
jgi:hypothetical protein